MLHGGAIDITHEAVGMDMANAFAKHLAGPEVAHIIANVIEMRARGADEDEFAEVHGLA